MSPWVRLRYKACTLYWQYAPPHRSTFYSHFRELFGEARLLRWLLHSFFYEFEYIVNSGDFVFLDECRTMPKHLSLWHLSCSDLMIFEVFDGVFYLKFVFCYLWYSKWLSHSTRPLQNINIFSHSDFLLDCWDFESLPWLTEILSSRFEWFLRRFKLYFWYIFEKRAKINKSFRQTFDDSLNTAIIYGDLDLHIKVFDSSILSGLYYPFRWVRSCRLDSSIYPQQTWEIFLCELPHRIFVWLGHFHGLPGAFGVFH